MHCHGCTGRTLTERLQVASTCSGGVSFVVCSKYKHMRSQQVAICMMTALTLCSKVSRSQAPLDDATADISANEAVYATAMDTSNRRDREACQMTMHSGCLSESGLCRSSNGSIHASGDVQ